MKVRKENRVLSVDKADEAFYLGEGYDVVELSKDGKSYEVVKEATGGKTYSVAEYNELKKERDTLKAADSSDELDTLNDENKKLKAQVKKLEKELKQLTDKTPEEVSK